MEITDDVLKVQLMKKDQQNSTQKTLTRKKPWSTSKICECNIFIYKFLKKMLRDCVFFLFKESLL